MALHTKLDIYRDTVKLLKLTLQLVRNFPRDVKPAFGRDLTSECFQMVLLIYRANVAHDKLPFLDELVERVNFVDTLFSIACDLQLISQGQYAEAIKLTGSCGAQAGGWRNYQKSASPVSSVVKAT